LPPTKFGLGEYCDGANAAVERRELSSRVPFEFSRIIRSRLGHPKTDNRDQICRRLQRSAETGEENTSGLEAAVGAIALSRIIRTFFGGIWNHRPPESCHPL